MVPKKTLVKLLFQRTIGAEKLIKPSPLLGETERGLSHTL
jgi:hypothetical protein